MVKSYAEQMLEFIEASPSTYHVVENAKKRLIAAGAEELEEHKTWSLTPGKSYFVVRNLSSVIAFSIPKKDYTGFNIVASHSDSPTFKIKENAEIVVNNEYVSLNTECYGGAIYATWLDRPLSVAGRIVVKEGKTYTTKLVNVEKDLLIIPNVAIHMEKTINEGKKFNQQKDLLPLLGDITSKGKFMEIIAENAGVSASNIISTDLFLYNRQKGCICGANQEYVCSPQLDDLQCAFASLTAFCNAKPANSIAVAAIFDNEEVGSKTKQGAASTFLLDTLTKINEVLGHDSSYYKQALASSFMISADNAHAVHPNNTALADPTNKPYINKGIVVKYHANQSYTTDAISAAIFKGMLDEMGVAHQSFTNRSDMKGGGTLGNIANSHVSLNTVDIGLPQFAMHSCYETAGVKDTEDMVKVCEKFFGITISKLDNNRYTVE